MDQEDMHNLAENLYLYRMQHDLGLVPFSIRAGIAHSNLRKIELGIRKNLMPATLKKLCKATGMTFSELTKPCNSTVHLTWHQRYLIMQWVERQRLRRKLPRKMWRPMIGLDRSTYYHTVDGNAYLSIPKCLRVARKLGTTVNKILEEMNEYEDDTRRPGHAGQADDGMAPG